MYRGHTQRSRSCICISSSSDRFWTHFCITSRRRITNPQPIKRAGGLISTYLLYKLLLLAHATTCRPTIGLYSPQQYFLSGKINVYTNDHSIQRPKFLPIGSPYSATADPRILLRIDLSVDTIRWNQPQSSHKVAQSLTQSTTDVIFR